MSMPKDAWKVVTIVAIVTFTIIYLSFAFIQDSWNMFEWGKEKHDQEDIRTLFVAVQIFFTGAATALTTIAKWKPDGGVV